MKSSLRSICLRVPVWRRTLGHGDIIDMCRCTGIVYSDLDCPKDVRLRKARRFGANGVRYIFMVEGIRTTTLTNRN